MVGVIPETVTLAVNVNAALFVTVAPPEVTEISTVAALAAGEVATISVALLMVKFVAANAPNLTAVTLAKFSPVIVI